MGEERSERKENNREEESEEEERTEEGKGDYDGVEERSCEE